MTANDRFVVRSRREGRKSLARIGDEVRLARTARGLSQAAVGGAAGVSRVKVARAEAGGPSVPILDYGAVCAAVGLDLSLRAYPVGPPLRDRAHAALLERLRSRLDTSLRWATEVPLPNPGDMRAWDTAVRGTDFRIGVEAETQVRDGQELERRLSTKLRGGAVDSVILFLSGTRSNRLYLRERAAALRATFPVGARSALAALAAAHSPGGNSIVVL
jgi:transcriptional regulator with XRE-family HTH domain